MGKSLAADVDGPEAIAALAETLENMAQSLADVVPSAADDQTRQTIASCLERIRKVSSSLRSIALLYDPAQARLFVKEGENLKSLAATVGQSVEELSGANQAIASKMGEHVSELDKIAELPPGKELARRLQATVSDVRQMAVEMQRNFDAISKKVETANESISALERELEEARQKALRDSLTKLHSRAALDEHLQAAITAGATRGAWCFLIVDIDHFKLVNDTHGHIVGDALLFKVARVIEDSVRWKSGRDLLARYGGEEFAIVLAGARLEAARTVAERIRANVAGSRWQYKGKADEEAILEVTISIGVAQYRSGDTAAGLVQRADDALYEAKEQGRNKVAVAEP